MNLGFTGSKQGMTPRQYLQVSELLTTIDPHRAHHGDCFGSDAQFHGLCRERGIYIVGHPGMDQYGETPYRAYCDVDEIEATLPYLERNRIIIDRCGTIIAAPKSFEEEIRSGTWFTVRKARKRKRTVYIVFPDGKISMETWKGTNDGNENNSPA